jgi:hypothetical protein
VSRSAPHRADLHFDFFSLAAWLRLSLRNNFRAPARKRRNSPEARERPGTVRSYGRTGISRPKLT